MSELLTYLSTHEEKFRRNRLAALYSDFRQLRTINPDGYTANIEAWCKGLADAAKEGHIPNRGARSDLLVLKVDDELLRALESKEWGRPLALGTVLRDAISRKEMVPLREFLNSEQSIYNKSWVLSPWSLVSWGLGKIGLAGSSYQEDALPAGKLVIMANVEAASKKVAEQIDCHNSRTERIYSKPLFCEAFAKVIAAENPMTPTDVDVLLKFMAREKDMLIYDGQTIKFKGLSEVEHWKITPEDSTIASLKTLIQGLTAQIGALNQRLQLLSSNAREALSHGSRVSALATLRSKKLTETALSRQAATLAQLEEVYLKICQAEDQVQLVRILEGSTGVLKALHAEVGGVERVDDVVEQLKEQMTKIDDVGNVIAAASQVDSVDEQEYERELEGMEREEKNKKEKERLEREKKADKETAEIKRRLESPENVDELSLPDRRTAQERPQKIQPFDKVIDEMALELNEFSLNEQISPENAT